MSETKRRDGELAERARRQLGVVTRKQALEAGLSVRELAIRTRRGELVKIGCQVYAIAGTPGSWEQRALAACLDVGEGAVLSHRSAARAWGLLSMRHPDIHVSVAYGSKTARSRPGAVVHRTRTLSGADRTFVGPLPLTSVARTLVDLSGVLEREGLAAVLDDALSRRLVSPRRVADTLSGLDASGPRRTGVLRALLVPWLGERRLGSVAEGAFLRVIVDAGLPCPRLQHKVSVCADASVYLDFAWPDQRVALEVDGFRWHARPSAHAEDSIRSNRLAALGWTVLHATPTELDVARTVVLAALRRHLVPTA